MKSSTFTKPSYLFYVPDLIFSPFTYFEKRFISASDPEVVKDGAKGIDELRKKEAMRHALVRNPDLCPAIAQVLNNPHTSEDVKKTLLGTLNNMTDTDAGRRAIFNGLTIPVLVKMLGDLNKKIVQYALSTLHSLEYHMPAEVVGPIRLAGGVGKMSEVLVERKASPHNPWSDKFLSLLLNSLEILCIKDNGSKTIFVSKVSVSNIYLMIHQNDDFGSS